MRILGVRLRFNPSRWIATRLFGRLGLIAATLSGLALAFHLGGRDGYTVPLTFLLGYPTNLLVHLIPGFALSSAGPASEWSINQLAWCTTIVGNWAVIGLAMDVVRWDRAPKPPAGLPMPQPDLIAEDEEQLLAAFADLERELAVRRRETTNIQQPAA
jgi:hypothetical protein